MKKKRNIALATLGVALGTMLVLTQTAWSHRDHQPFKLEGSWLAKDASGLSWTYVFAPCDSDGREAAFTSEWVTVDPTFGLFPDAEYIASVIGEAAVTGPNEAVFTVVEYGMKKVGSVPQKVYILQDSGTIKETAPRQTEVAHNISFYLPTQDADGDGLPDKGQTPLLCVPGTSIDIRLPLLRPCKP